MQFVGQLVHGDVSIDNIVMSEQGDIVFLDWDTCRTDMRLEVDLVQFFWRIARVGKDPQAAMTAYLDECPLTQDEALLFPLFASSAHAYAYCLRRVMKGIWNEEDDVIADMLVDGDPARVVDAPWQIMDELRLRPVKTRSSRSTRER